MWTSMARQSSSNSPNINSKFQFDNKLPYYNKPLNINLCNSLLSNNNSKLLATTTTSPLATTTSSAATTNSTTAKSSPNNNPCDPTCVNPCENNNPSSPYR